MTRPRSWSPMIAYHDYEASRSITTSGRAAEGSRQQEPHAVAQPQHADGGSLGRLRLLSVCFTWSGPARCGYAPACSGPSAYPVDQAVIDKNAALFTNPDRQELRSTTLVWPPALPGNSIASTQLRN